MDFKAKKLLVFDMDGTLITNNTWFDFNLAIGVSAAEDETLYQQYNAGTLLYEDWVTALNEHYARHEGQSREVVDRVLTASYTLRPGAKETLTELHARGYQTAIITGSFSTTAEAMARDLGITYALGNATPHFSEQNHFTHISVRGEERIVKVEQLRTLCTTLGITPEDCAVVGDSSNDLDLFAVTQAGITFTWCSEHVRTGAKATITELPELLPLF